MMENHKTKLIHGVELTTVEEMNFSKYISNNRIALNTMEKEQRAQLVKEWVKNERTKEDTTEFYKNAHEN